jgi:Lrp/AsnC family transcriptional regulator
MDELDRKILGELQTDAERSVQEIADRIGLSATPTARRIRLLKEAGVIKKHVALLDRDNLDLGVTVFVSVRTSEHNQAWLDTFAKGVELIPEVVEFYRMSGDVDYLMKIIVSDLADYDDVYKRLIKIAPLNDVTSSFAMECLKDTTELPLQNVGDL